MSEIWVKKEIEDKDVELFVKLLSRGSIAKAEIKNGIFTYVTLPPERIKSFEADEKTSEKISSTISSSLKRTSFSMLDYGGTSTAFADGSAVMEWPAGSTPRLVYERKKNNIK